MSDGLGRSLRVKLMVALVFAFSAVMGPCGVAPAFGSGGGSAITARGTAASAPHATSRVTLTVPARAKPGDVLVASLNLQGSGATSKLGLKAPRGWTRVSRTHRRAVGTLAVYWHVLAAGEKRYAWTTGAKVGGVAFLAAFGGVDTRRPIDGSASASTSQRRSIPAPSVTTTVAGDTLVSSYFAYRRSGASSSWQSPPGMKQLRDAANANGHSGSLHYGVQATAGRSGPKTARASVPQDTAVAVLTALRAARPVPIIIDTDIYSSVDDVGALGTAFALQIRHEAHVIAISVNTRNNRPAVATNSWRCAAAIAQFYGAGDTPIGTDMPNNGTSVNTIDYTGPCSRLASPSTPTPQPAVSVLRQALAGQADGSVVMVGTGYSENLAALLNSPGDAISPLSGRDLVAQKVKMLVRMAGAYPRRVAVDVETNLNGNPEAAQAVTANWPTKIVWSGLEIGDRVHSGDTISRIHPANSPIRVAYEAFVGPNNWIDSYDLTAVYHAVRPLDSVLTEVGPGTNSIDGIGGNTFTLGGGNQFYLKLSRPKSIDASIEVLLDTLPAR